ncbi:uncharacterized protein LOC126753609 isoform X18 [Bactrocera neohumeralis]|uniref:uncharacterized protein LOC126753609 isoform X11 n=1 Tax=Bactrocera neohumeralis TaxID=98809 RepID=UPI0021669720|nr:uncharacterized protein LOC126753609 isoform X11 [Bactrocera neohumeralis]XP_050321151.1 uncharacterized protein LOC126753609 isoform X15 [Bactrocera neohumeralis]XP_050321153.1 uncharacterized protein LOC126753609 isoform X17 [Bactrocera neohumeralis]XP_050321155.1 uncharacterized protein LOC126753609 isoform X18 [Bactrocera neohumeralis]
MNKRTFSNLLSKEKASFNASVAKFRKLNEFSNISKSDPSRRAVSKFLFCDVPDNSKETLSNFEIEDELEYGSDQEFLAESPSSDPIDAKQRDGEEMSCFCIDEPHSQLMATQLEPNKNANTAMVLQKILETLGRVESRQGEMIKRLSAVENALTEKMPERAEVQAQSQLLRECKVLSAKTHRSVSRITGDVVSEEQLLLQSLLPMSSEETVLKVEEYLADKAHTDAMATIILDLKSKKGSIEKVLRSLFSDKLIWLYNCDGKAGKRPLTKLKTVDLTLAAFASMHIHKTSIIRRYVSLSHNRYKHFRRYMENALTEKMPERAEVQAQSQSLRECKVPTVKTHRSVSRITGDVLGEKQLNVENALTEKMPERAEVQAQSQLLRECKVPSVTTHCSVSRITGDVLGEEQLNVENALTEKMPERAEVQAQSQLLRECKVPSEKTHRSVNRITDDVVSEQQLLLQSLLPMSSEETVLKVEEYLADKAHADAMTAIILDLKSTKGSIEMVLRTLFTDELMWLYNCDGKAGKRALTKLKTVDLTLAAFASMDINKTKVIRRYVNLSHNRYKHIRRSIRRSNVFYDLSD